MPKVYVTAKIPEDGILLLKQKGYEVEVNGNPTALGRDEFRDKLQKYDAVITLVSDKIDNELLSAAGPRLKVIANYGVGYDNIDVLEAKRRGIIVTNTPGVASESVAEHTFMLIFACVKHLLEADNYVRLGKYKVWDPMLFLSSQIWGKTIGIIGLGKIGTFVAQIAYGGLRMQILYSDPRRSEDFELLTEAKYVPRDELLTQSDIVTIHAPLSDKTHHLIGKEQFKMMKNTAILVNTARGPIVDEEALVWALKEKEIAACGLDVYEHEPNIAPELLTMPNVILTPHIASATYETRRTMSRIVAENIIAVFEGKEPVGLVKIS